MAHPFETLTPDLVLDVHRTPDVANEGGRGVGRHQRVGQRAGRLSLHRGDVRRREWGWHHGQAGLGRPGVLQSSQSAMLRHRQP